MQRIKLQQLKEFQSILCGEIDMHQVGIPVECVNMTSFKNLFSDVSLEMPEFSAMERVILNCNGNLQKIISDFHACQVSVRILKNDIKDSFTRNVLLQLNNRVTFGVAVSSVRIDDEEIRKYYFQESPSIGQIFRYFNILPKFKILKMARDEDLHPRLAEIDEYIDEGIWSGLNGFKGYFWRDYELIADGIYCRIIEVLRNDIFDTDLKNSLN